jgi:hypothetical protein
MRGGAAVAKATTGATVSWHKSADCKASSGMVTLAVMVDVLTNVVLQQLHDVTAQCHCQRLNFWQRYISATSLHLSQVNISQ